MSQDSAWKNILEELFPEFLLFFFPEIYQDIDFTKKYEFLDKELRKILKGGRVGKRIVDKLVKVYLKDGSEKWLLIHIEIQGYREKNFPERIYIYNYRIFDFFKKVVVSLVILTDKDPQFRANEYRVSQWGMEHIFRFPAIKLIDYLRKWDELEVSENPFALVVMAYLRTIETEGDQSQRYQWKKKFLIELYSQGMKRETILSLYRFIDWIMVLPENLDDEIYKDLNKFEEEKHMPVLTTAERIGMKKGLEKGLQQGLQQGLHRAIALLVEVKFGDIGSNLLERVDQITEVEKLEQICEILKNTAALAEAEKLISEISGD